MRLLVLALLLLAAPLRAGDRAGDRKAAPRTAPQITVTPLQPLPYVSPLVGNVPSGVALPQTAQAQAGAAAALNAPAAAAVSRDRAVPLTNTAVPALPAPVLVPQTAAQPPPSAAAAPSAAASEDSGGASHPLVQRVKDEARKLGTAAYEDAPKPDVERELAQLRTRGWSLLPAGSIVTPALASSINRYVDANKDKVPFNTWELQDEYKGTLRDAGGTKELIDEVTRRLQAALPGEGITLRDAQLRVRPPDARDSDMLHVDGGYITFTITLKGPGTLLYDVDAKGNVRELEAPVNSVAIITNTDRERATGVAGTVHSSPSPSFFRDQISDRRVLIVRYKRAGQERAKDDEREPLRRKQEARKALAQRHRDSLRPPPKERKGFFGRLLE